MNCQTLKALRFSMNIIERLVLRFIARVSIYSQSQPIEKTLLFQTESFGDNMLTLNDLDTFDRLFEFVQSYEQALEKFILYKTKQKTLEDARNFAVINPDIGWIFNKIDLQQDNE